MESTTTTSAPGTATAPQATPVPVQLTFARSVDPIVPLEFAITRKSVTTVEEAEKQSKADGSITGTMGRKNTVPYALYKCHGFVNPYLAKDTGFSDADLQLLPDGPPKRARLLGITEIQMGQPGQVGDVLPPERLIQAKEVAHHVVLVRVGGELLGIEPERVLILIDCASVIPV